MKVRQWKVGPDHICEKSEYVNLGVFKNYCGSFDKNIDENSTKAAMLFSADFDRRRMNPMVYIKFWRQACILALLFGEELWTVTKSGLEKLERCQRWFLRKPFHLLDFADSLLLNVIRGLSYYWISVASEKAIFS